MDDGTSGREPTVADLYLVEGQAELIGGRIVRLPPHGRLIGRIVGKVARSLMNYEEHVGVGEAYTSTLAYIIPTARIGPKVVLRPDASYHLGPFPDNPMHFIEGPPTFAVEVRDEDDYGSAAEAEMAAKRADYFEAGTPVVWDVDPVAELIHAYRIDDPTTATTFARGGIAEAEPAVPNWRIAVDVVFG